MRILCYRGIILMRMLLLFMMLTVCAAAPQDLSGKMFTFPKSSTASYVKLTTSRQPFSAITVCLRSFTDLNREHSLFSLSSSSFSNNFLIFKTAEANAFEVSVKNQAVLFYGQDYKLNAWHSICATWELNNGLAQFWMDGKYSSKKFAISTSVAGNNILILGQEQDSYGGDFHAGQSLVGMLSDVHMWDYVLSPCEIRRYMHSLNFTPGNVLNWRALDFQLIQDVVLEDNQLDCPA